MPSLGELRMREWRAVPTLAVWAPRAQCLVVMSPLGRRASALGECWLLVGGGSMGFWCDVVACGRLIIWVTGLRECESKGLCVIIVVSCIYVFLNWVGVCMLSIFLLCLIVFVVEGSGVPGGRLHKP